MKNFSLTSYLYEKAFRRGRRGVEEVRFMDSLTQKSKLNDLVSPFSLRALTAGTTNKGKETLANDVIQSYQNFYSASIFLSHGTILSSLTSNVTIDAKNAAAILTKKAVTETTTAANTFSTEPVFSAVTLKPKFIRASIELSRTLIEQTSSTIDSLIVDEMTAALSEELDRQILKGNSSSDEIKGIVNTTGISSDTWGALSALTGASAHSKLADAENDLGTAKVPSPYYFLLNSETRKRLRSVRNTGNSYPIFTDQSEILGYRAMLTENLSDSECWLVNPVFCIVGMWHDDETFDLIVDGYTQSNRGKVVLTMSILADAVLVKPKALSVISES